MRSLSRSSGNKDRWLSPYLLTAALMPVLLQLPEDCAPSSDTTLAVFELEVAGVNQIVDFGPNKRGYTVYLADDADLALLRVQASDPQAQIFYAMPNNYGRFPYGAGEATLDLPPAEQLTLRVQVEPWDGTIGYYTVTILRDFPCTEQGIRDAIAQGSGSFSFDCTGPTTVTTGIRMFLRIWTLITRCSGKPRARAYLT